MIGIGTLLWYSDKYIICHIIMSVYIGNDLEDRLKILQTENASLKKNTVITIKWYMKLTICQTYM